jgi:two-component system LytT family sensor kinase
MDPESVGRDRDTELTGNHVGLVNVDDRLRAAFGEDYGLVVETAPDAGTKVIVRLPKFAPGVSARPR